MSRLAITQNPLFSFSNNDLMLDVQNKCDVKIKQNATPIDSLVCVFHNCIDTSSDARIPANTKKKKMRQYLTKLCNLHLEELTKFVSYLV